jgi:hypothetical protein
VRLNKHEPYNPTRRAEGGAYTLPPPPPAGVERPVKSSTTFFAGKIARLLRTIERGDGLVLPPPLAAPRLLSDGFSQTKQVCNDCEETPMRSFWTHCEGKLAYEFCI